jgi:hypothetical protein
MNAGTQAILIRYSLRELGGLPERHLPYAEAELLPLWADAKRIGE